MSLQVDLKYRSMPQPYPAADITRGAVSVIDGAAYEWRELCGDGPFNEPFNRPEWNSAYLRAFEPQTNVVLVTVRRGGRLRAILPLAADSNCILGAGITQAAGPEHLIVGEILNDLQRTGMTELGMLVYSNPYEARWTDLSRQHYQCHDFGRGPTGLALQTWTEYVLSAGQRVHRKLRGLDAANCGVEFGAIGMIGQETVRWC